jgi:exodeoxyribonuclease VIII
MIPLGLHPDLPDAEYRADPGINASLLKAVDRSPAYALHLADQPSDKPCFTDGRAIHSEVLEPDHFDARYIVVPDDAPRKPTKAQWGAKKPSSESMEAMLYWDELNSTAAGRSIIGADDYEMYRGITDAVWSHAGARTLLEAKGYAEASMFSDCPVTGIRQKCRWDKLLEDMPVGIDLKSTTDASAEGFQHALKKFGWGIQDAHYSATFNALFEQELEAFLFICVEKTPPYLVQIHRIEEDDRALLRLRRDQLMLKTQQCRTSGIWPGYSSQIQTTRLSGYHRNTLSAQIGNDQ